MDAWSIWSRSMSASSYSFSCYVWLLVELRRAHSLQNVLQRYYVVAVGMMVHNTTEVSTTLEMRVWEAVDDVSFP